MYYWSRWTSNTTTLSRANETQGTRSAWQDTDYRLAAQRNTRPVVVLTRDCRRPRSTSSTHQRGRFSKRAISPRISLDVRRQTHPFGSAARWQTLAGVRPEATTQPVLEQV